MESRKRLMILERKMVQNGLIKDYPDVEYDIYMRIYLHSCMFVEKYKMTFLFRLTNTKQ